MHRKNISLILFYVRKLKRVGALRAHYRGPNTTPLASNTVEGKGDPALQCSSIQEVLEAYLE